MSKRFEPVRDTERPRSEQNEEELRKHRQFDTPFALLPKNLNDPKKPKGDMEPISKKSEDLEKDAKGLWKKKSEGKGKGKEVEDREKTKSEVFDREQTWGRETFQYSNPEEAKNEGTNVNRKKRPGDVEWGTRGTFGGKVADNGVMVLQRGEVDQQMRKNEKGLWEQVKKPQDDAAETKQEPVPDGGWRCKKCGAANDKKAGNFCKSCDMDKTLYEQYKTKASEDPRMEAAGKKGRGTADAQAKALAALEARRQKESAMKDQMGLSRAPANNRRQGPDKFEYVPLNSSSMMVRDSKRSRKHQGSQGVQQNDEDAAKVVHKAVGGGKDDAKPVRVEDTRQDLREKRKRARSSSASSLRCSRSGSREGKEDGGKDGFAWESPERSRSPATAQKARSPSPRSKRLGRSVAAEAKDQKVKSPSPRSRRLGRSRPSTGDGDCGGGSAGDVVVDFF